MITISICIPNFNKGNELLELLQSIELSIQASTNSCGHEIVICDNCSTDESFDQVRQYSNRSHLNIHIFENSANIGFQRNLLAAVKHASGDYIWLMGSDDLFHQNTWRLMEGTLLGSNKDVYIFNRLLCDASMTNCVPDSYVSVDDSMPRYSFSSCSRDLAKYIDASLNVNSLGCFISTFVFSRDFQHRYLAAHDCLQEIHDKNVWPHVLLAWHVLTSSDEYSLQYISTPLIKWRPANSSFSLTEFEKYCDLIHIAEFISGQSIRKSFLMLAARHYKKSIPTIKEPLSFLPPPKANSERLSFFRKSCAFSFSRPLYYPFVFRFLRTISLPFFLVLNNTAVHLKRFKSKIQKDRK